MTNGEEVLDYVSLPFTLNCFTSYVNDRLVTYTLVNLFYK